MKSILLTSTALVAFAGAAFAESHEMLPVPMADGTPMASAAPMIEPTPANGVVIGADGSFGYNEEVENGFYFDGGLMVTTSAGMTVAATFGLNVVENDLGETVSTSGWALSLTAGDASLSVGEVDPVAEANWSGVDGATTADFNDFDAHTAAGFEAVIAGQASMGGFTGMISYGVNTDGPEDPLDAMQLYVSGDVGAFGMQAAYQEEFGGADAIFAVGASTSSMGADVQVSYVDDGTESSLGVAAAYPFGPVTVSGYYSFNDVAENNWGVAADYSDGPVTVNVGYDYDGTTEEGSAAIDASYDLGNGVSVLAGYDLGGVDTDGDETYYVAAEADLGGGATFLVSYAADEDDLTANDDIDDYLEGTTVEVGFSF